MHRQLLLLFILVLLCSTLCPAQGRINKAEKRSPYTYIYQVNNKEACNIYKDGPQVINTSYFHSLIDSFAVNTSFNKTLPQGHYLFMHSNGPDLIYHLRTFSTLSTKLLQVKPALALLVHDSLGKSIAGAEVRLNGRKALYDPVTQTYRLEKTPRKGLLAVSFHGFTLFEKLERDEAVAVAVAGRSLLGNVIGAAPIRYIWRPFYDAYKSIQWQYPKGWVRSLFSVFDAQYRHPDSYHYKGYLVMNKPMYQPRDTVRFKSYVVEKDGKPVKGKVLLQLQGPGNGAKKLGEVASYRKGGYEGYFVLHDSLKLELDQPYTLSLLKRGKRQRVYSSGSFRYEDYELMENDYTLDLKYEEHQSGRENSILLRGTNANGLNLLDARVEITLLTKRVVHSEAPVLFIPDTLWVHQQPLDAMGQTSILIPDNVFPEAAVDYTVTAAFLNASNERVTRTKDASYSHTKGNFKLSLLQDSLLVQYMEGGAEKPVAAELTAYDVEYKDIIIQKIELPTRIPLYAFAAGYEVTAGDLSADLELTEEAALVELHASRATDSIFFSLQNPRRLPYWYFVYRGEKVVARGQGNDTSFLFQQLAKGEKPYFVAVQYVWAGEMHQLKEDAPLQKHLLSINLQAPAVVYPGQETSMKIAVTDAKGKAVPDVDLTAYAITSKFKSQTIPGLPSWDRYKRQRPHRRLVKATGGVGGKKLLDWNYWGRRMGLDSLAYYHFLYPKERLFTAFTNTSDSLTQVSPFVVDSGRVVPVHVVYLDEVPVYFSQTDVLPAYAFAADSGYHTIKLRTAEKLITLDSVYLQHRRKLIISADITAATNPYAQKAVKRKLSAPEQQSLYRYLFYVDQKYNEQEAYLKQGNRLHLLLPNNQRRFYYDFQRGSQLLLSGPFSPSWIQYVRQNSFTTNFIMESGYSYHFAPDLLKMREQKLPAAKVRLPYWNKWERKPELLEQEALTDRKIHEIWKTAEYERLLGSIFTDNSVHPSENKTGRIGWELQGSVRRQVNFVFLHEAGSPDSLLVFPRESSIIYNLKPGTYTLTLSFEKGDFASDTVAVKPYGQTQVYFKASAIAPASQQSAYLLQLVEKRVAQLKKEDKEKSAEQEQQLRVSQETTFSYTNGSELYSHQVSGVVTDKADGFPLPGVSVSLKDTKIGAVTDAGGQFRLYVPADGVLVFGYIGYVSTEVHVDGRGTLNLKLETDIRQLSEVVVTGYASSLQEKRTVAYVMSDALEGKTAGIMVRGNTSVSVTGEHAKPLLIVDGVPYSGSQEDLKNILSMKILKGEEATALYGAAGAAGVIIISTKRTNVLAAGGEALLPSTEATAIRNNFSDNAIWQPRLRTDKQGEATFQVTFPDDVTSWNAYVLGMDEKKHSGIHSTSIRSFKAMMATLHLPRFLIEGDTALVIGKALNYLPDSSTVTTRFKVGGQQVKEETRFLNRSFTNTVQVTAPAVATDSVEVLYSLQQENGFTDGERRYVRVYPKGIAETTGKFLPLYTDTTFTLTFDPAKGPVRLHAQGNLLEVMLDEVDYLHQYEYWCSEQAASKLKGLLVEKRIREQLSQPFAYDRMVQKLIRHLEKTQLKEGAWTWWQRGPAYAWITAHVTEALVMARKEGYAVRFQEQKLVDYLVYLLERGNSYDKLTALETLHQLGAEVEYSRYVHALEKKPKLPLEEQLRLTRMRQRLSLPAQLDTLQKHRKQTMLGGLYWGEEKYSLFNNSISNTLLAYQILRAAGNQERELTRIRAYLLSERGAGHWRNTYESARVLEALLPDLLLENTAQAKLTVSVIKFSGALNMESTPTAMDTTFAANSPLLVQKQGELPLYLTAWQTFWNPTPQPVAKDFVVSTTWKRSKERAVLQAGTPVEMLVEVEVKADAEYIMIDVPIPASCSYDSKEGKGAFEVHREYYRNKVSIFCDRMPKGKYTYTIQLLPRYSGTYTLNPARAELMYFPTFFGRNIIKHVFVK